jgi:hypothetical protein
MSDDGVFVRGFGDLARGRGGIAWSVGDGGAVTLENGQSTLVEAEAVDPGSAEGHRFDSPLDGDTLAAASVFRHIVVEIEEGMIVCTAIGPEGIAGHADERTEGVLHTGGEQVPYVEALISTQYDASGDPTRFGLELWPVDADQTARAAATRVSGSLLGGARSGSAWGGFFRCHTDGVEGIGTYVLWRA